jgi:hypothetical protein
MNEMNKPVLALVTRHLKQGRKDVRAGQVLHDELLPS